MKEYNFLYTGAEYLFRLNVFVSNLRAINQHNNQHHSYTLSLNQFSAMTHSEYRSFLGHKKNTFPTKTIPSSFASIPPQWDWRTKGIVTPIRDQKSCGAGWAFAACAAQESTWALQHHQLLVLSPSNLIDCDWMNDGCDLGDSYSAVYYVISEQNGHFVLEKDYPYTDQQNTCNYSDDIGVTILKNITYTWNETSMAEDCYRYGLIVSELDASSMNFASYSGGIYDSDDCSPWYLCHSLNIVGYGTEGGVDYWILKNSFGMKWGESGYMRMIRGKGLCGIDMESFYLTVG